MLDRIYICGPMRGYPEHNYPAFNAAAEQFRAADWVVANPAEIGAIFAHSPFVPGSEYIREDLLHLARCNAIALLPGWDASTGARCEVAVAITLGLAFYDAITGKPIEQPARCVVSGGYTSQPGPIPDLTSLVAEIEEWQLATFPQGTAASCAAHLESEVAELLADPSDPSELADCFFLIVGAARRAGVDLNSALREKLAINRARQWGQPNESGYVEHLEVAADARD